MWLLKCLDFQTDSQDDGSYKQTQKSKHPLSQERSVESYIAVLQDNLWVMKLMIYLQAHHSLRHYFKHVSNQSFTFNPADQENGIWNNGDS